MRVEELMTRELRTCDTRASVNDAAQIMWEHDCGCVPVVNGSYVLVGMLTDRDVAMAAYTQGKPLAQIPIAEAMSRQLYCCQEGSSVVEAQACMRTNGVRRLPVLDRAGKLIGLITLSDIARAAAKAGPMTVAELGAEQTESTLSAVTGHRAQRGVHCDV